MFNPRGRSLGDIDDVQRVIGLTLNCIDDNGAAMGAIPNLPNAVRNRLLAWRAAAQAYMATNPPPSGLQAFVDGWRTRTSGFVNQNWPRDWPILELVFTLVTWFPGLQADPEGQVYLEAITRTISEVGQFASYRARSAMDTECMMRTQSVRQSGNCSCRLLMMTLTWMRRSCRMCRATTSR